MQTFLRIFVKTVMIALVCAGSFSQQAAAQTERSPKGELSPQAKVMPPARVTQIDINALRKLIKPNGKPLLINFWATWCDPCRDEFPDLVKIDAEFHGKIDFIVISLDDLVEINRDVPKFLLENKAQMPAYLLKTPDEDVAITAVTSEWNGNLPLTILFKENGETAYLRKGPIRLDTLRENINKVLPVEAVK
jgi:thiol-disulfide isomerase/thioredoxin